MRLLITFARDYPWQTATMLLALLFAGIAEGIGLTALLPLLDIALETSETGAVEAKPNSISAMVNQALTTVGLSPTIGTLLTFFMLAIIIKSMLVMFAQKRVGYAVAHVTTSLRLSLLRAMLRTRWEFYLDQRIGKLANAMTSEAIRAGNAFSHGINMIALGIQALVYAAVALMVSWRATLACLAAASVLLLISHFLVKMTRRAGKRQTKLLRSLLSKLTDTLQSVKPLKAMARESLADAVLTAETEQVNRSLRREVFSKEMLKAVQEPMFAAVVVGGIFVSVVQWELPMAQVMVLVLLLLRLMSYLGKVQREFQKTVAFESAFWSLQRTITSAEQAREPLEGILEPTLERGIEMDRVSFRYGERQILDGLSLSVPAGALSTLVGPSGSGKTTIVDLVIGLLKPQQGQILVDGQPIEDIDLHKWRQLIGYVPQETLLLHDTVYNNVTLADPALDDADAERALRGAGAWDFVAALPNGMYEVVGERGAKLSGGQRQRIMIARALVHQPQLLIMDEATSALDPASEAAICQTLQNLRGKLTILAISHQRALVDAADRVYRLHGGQADQVTEPAADLSVV